MYLKQAFTLTRFWRLSILMIAGATFWLAVFQVPGNPLLTALIAAFVLGVAVDLLILPRDVLWQLVPSIALAGMFLALPTVTASAGNAPSLTRDNVLLLGVLLGLALLLFLILVGVPAILGATITWTLRTAIAEQNATWPRRFSMLNPSRYAKICTIASRAVGMVLVIGTVALPAFVPFHGTEGQRVYSPDGRYAAWVRESNCGVPCSFHPWIVVQDNERRQLPWFWRPEEATIFDTRHTSPSEISLRWMSDRHLVVTFVNYDSEAIAIQEPEWNEVAISYNPIPR